MPHRSAHPPQKHNSYDIRNKLLLFESQELLHKNASWRGDRYAIVFFNKDLNYVTTRKSKQCQRSIRLLKQNKKKPVTWLKPKRKNVTAMKRIEQKRDLLFSILKQTRFLEDRTSGLKPSSKYGNHRGTFISFGVSKTRKNRKVREEQGLYTRKNTNQNNTKYKAMYIALKDYVNTMIPHFFGTDDSNAFHMCIVAKNSQCEWHHDAGNVGPAVITTIGDFEGGHLLVEDTS
jgi:hypothetical protein